MNKVKLIISGALVALVALIGVNALVSSSADASDCSGNAVIRCGISTVDDIRGKFDADASTRNIFAAYNLTSDVVHNAATKAGTTTKNGDVIVDGKVVATNAHSAGRQYISGSVQKNSNGTTYYDSSNQTAFRSNSIGIIAFFDGNGQFIGAVMYDCGNPVAGNPVPVPPKPPTPVYACNSLTAAKLDRTNFKFTTNASAANGAAVQDYVYNFGDGSSATAGSSTTHAYANPGTYNVSVTVRVNVNGQLVNAPGNCVATVTITPEMCTVPGKEQYPKDDARCFEDKPGVSIEKFVNNKKRDSVVVNVNFDYKVVVTNTGNVDLKAVLVSDPAPAGVTFVSAAEGTITDNKWSITLDTLKVGASKTFTIVAKLPAYIAGDVVNEACVDTPTVPGTPDDCDKVPVDTPKLIKVCNTKTMGIETIDEKDFDESYMTTDLTKCTVTPPELPHTGVSDVIGSVLGIGSIVGVTLAYVASRRSL